MTSVQQPPPPPPPTPSSSGNPSPPTRSPPYPQHAAIPIPHESPPVQETSGSSPPLQHSQGASAPPLQNISQFPASQHGAGHEPSDGNEEKKRFPVQETDPAPQALVQQTAESEVPNEANPQTAETGEERLP